jgi:hypothetical protein
MIFTQKKFLKGTQKFEITDDNKILVEVNTGSTKIARQFDLLELKPEEAKIRQFSSPNFFVSLIAGLLLFCVLIGLINTPLKNNEDIGGRIFTYIIIVSIEIYIIGKFINSMVNCVAFYGWNGNALITPWYNNPNKEKFENFITYLKKRISEAISNQITLNQQAQVRSSDTIAGEILGLKKLLDDGILTPEEFEKAKAKVLGASGSKIVGFSQSGE